MDGSRGRTSRSANDWRQSLAAAIWTSLILLTAVLYSQKLTGTILPVTSPAVACLVATLAMVPSLLAWILWAPLGMGHSRSSSHFKAGAVTLIVPLAAAIAFLPANFGFAHWYVATLSVAASIAIVLSSNSDLLVAATRTKPTTHTSNANYLPYVPTPEFPSRLAGEGQGGGAELPDALDVEESRVGETHHEVLPAFDRGLHPPYHSQQLTRTTSPAHGDMLEGSVTVHFEPRQRQANVHIPFVPPFSSIPATEFEALDGCDIRLKLGTIQTFGLRIEARRTGDCDAAESAEIGFSAVVAAHQANAAA